MRPFFSAHYFAFGSVHLSNLILLFCSSALRLLPSGLLVLNFTSIAFKLFSLKSKILGSKYFFFYINFLENSDLLTAFISNSVPSLPACLFYPYLFTYLFTEELLLCMVFQGCLSSAESRCLQTHLISQSVLFLNYSSWYYLC